MMGNMHAFKKKESLVLNLEVLLGSTGKYWVRTQTYVFCIRTVCVFSVSTCALCVRNRTHTVRMYVYSLTYAHSYFFCFTKLSKEFVAKEIP